MVTAIFSILQITKDSINLAIEEPLPKFFTVARRNAFKGISICPGLLDLQQQYRIQQGAGPLWRQFLVAQIEYYLCVTNTGPYCPIFPALSVA